jgi:hypothetical protein
MVQKQHTQNEEIMSVTRQEVVEADRYLREHGSALAASSSEAPPPDPDAEIERLLSQARDSTPTERYAIVSRIRELRASAEPAGKKPKPPPPLPLSDRVEDLLSEAQKPETSPTRRYELLTKAKALRSQPDRWANVQFTPAGR